MQPKTMISVKGILRKVSHIDYESKLIAISMTITIIECVALLKKKPWLYLKNLTIFQNLLDYHNSYEKDQTITKYTMNYQNSKFHVPRGMVLDFRA